MALSLAGQDEPGLRAGGPLDVRRGGFPGLLHQSVALLRCLPGPQRFLISEVQDKKPDVRA